MTLRSLMIGDCDYYFSPYIHGVAAASGRLGILHSQVNIRAGFKTILARIQDVQPHILWTHMLLWPPVGSRHTSVLLYLCRQARQRYGTKVIIHDGDYKKRTRHAVDISDAVDLALVNHRHDRSAWKVPTLYWPYACFPQDELAAPVPSLRCGVAFAGQVSRGAVYNARTAFVDALMAHPEVDLRVFDGTGGNTLLRTADLAASADAILGFGRPGSDWVDNRVFQYPGAGAILLHDDVPEDSGMEPWSGVDPGHYVPYESGNPESVIDALRRLRCAGPIWTAALRQRAFLHGQDNHSYTARVKQVLRHFNLLE